jgi:hypothetical protein
MNDAYVHVGQDGWLFLVGGTNAVVTAPPKDNLNLRWLLVRQGLRRNGCDTERRNAPLRVQSTYERCALERKQ